MGPGKKLPAGWLILVRTPQVQYKSCSWSLALGDMKR